MTISAFEAKFSDELERDREWRKLATGLGIEIVEREDLVAARRDRALAALDAEFGADG